MISAKALRCQADPAYTAAGVKTTHVTKELFLSTRVCPTLGWFLQYEPLKLPPTEGDLFRMEQGKEIGRLARSLFPDGRLVPSGTNEATSAKTLKCLRDSSVTAVFEGTLLSAHYVAKPDLLLRDRQGWRVVEVKSALADTARIDELIDDLAYTVLVLRQSGLNVTGAELMLLARGYRKGQAASRLFERLDQTSAVDDRMGEFSELWKTVYSTITGPKPTAKLTPNCRACPYVDSRCLGKGVKHSVFCLPRLHANVIHQLSAQGIASLLDIPEDCKLTGVQKRVVDCVRSGKPFVSKNLGMALKQVEWPVCYLDFETVQTALPLYDGLPPYTQVTTQYSLHRQRRPNGPLGHAGYLSDPTRDCEEKLARRLLTDCGEKGSIVVYSSFEKTRILTLARRFPRISTKLLKLSERLFDLLRVVQDGYYHPSFGGSFSIKVVLPALVPDLRYDGLAIRDGDTAVARFARMALGAGTAAGMRLTRKDLLDYCRMDTLAMVRLHQALLDECRRRGD